MLLPTSWAVRACVCFVFTGRLQFFHFHDYFSLSCAAPLSTTWETDTPAQGPAREPPPHDMGDETQRGGRSRSMEV